jgi:hypothetical protein
VRQIFEPWQEITTANGFLRVKTIRRVSNGLIIRSTDLFFNYFLRQAIPRRPRNAKANRTIVPGSGTAEAEDALLGARVPTRIEVAVKVTPEATFNAPLPAIAPSTFAPDAVTSSLLEVLTVVTPVSFAAPVRVKVVAETPSPIVKLPEPDSVLKDTFPGVEICNRPPAIWVLPV